jgi:uncharacterized protein (TIGR00369 family)
MVDQKGDYNGFLKLLHKFFEQRIPFNKVLGIKVEMLDMESVSLRIDMRDDLIGNPVKKVLHGGVISSTLDVTGGITAAMGVLKKIVGYPPEDIGNRLLNVSTIDLRVDYLRPGRGSIMRTGQKVAVVRMQLHNDEELLIAVGTGTYSVG